MARRRGKRTTQTIIYIFSGIVALSMILGLLGPILNQPVQRRRTRVPTWTPWPTATPAPTPTTVVEGPPAPPPTAVPTATPPVAVGPPVPPTATPTVEPEAATPTVEADTPVAGPSKPLVFAVAGDNRGNEEVYRRVLDKVVEDGNAFLINTGDLVGYGSRKNFEAFAALMADFPLPFYPVPGNHDRDDDGSLANYVEFSGAPATHYAFDVENVHFTMANVSSSILSDEELAWIDADLAATEQPLKMVCIHYPPFDPDGGAHTLHGGNEAFMALMQKHSVDYVFAGHIHAYGQEERDGTVYVITGGAGAALYEEDHPNSFYHYVQVVVEGTEITTTVVRIE
jgi:predicted phosphodiesterase